MALIEAEEVQKTYSDADNGNRVVALENISVAVQERDFVCVLGPSGCGKTTLLNLIAGFLAPTEGVIRFDGRPVREPGPQRAVVFQESALFPWLSVAGNIDFVMRMNGTEKAERAATAERLIGMQGLKGFEEAYPHELSGGMKQRVALARALALGPRVLLMDEPFGALDAQTRERLQDELLRIWQQTKKTILFVTHNVAEAAYLGQRVIVLSERPGTIQADVAVELGRPRRRLSDDVRGLERRLLNAMPGYTEGRQESAMAGPQRKGD